jgi:hypothetical protein
MFGAMIGVALCVSEAAQCAGDENSTNPLAALAVYGGNWKVRATHPWSGAARGAVDRLTSRCQMLSQYYVCEQTVNDKTLGLILYTIGKRYGELHSRFVAPDGEVAPLGDLTLRGNHWTYLDRPAGHRRGKWSRTENVVLNENRIVFEEYESSDQGQTWVKTNSGTEDRGQ